MRLSNLVILCATSALVAAGCGTPAAPGQPGTDAGGGATDAGTSTDGDAGATDGGGAGDGGPANVTWYRDVLPIVQSSCQGCHLEGGVAPFALETYADGFAMHDAIAVAVGARTMPPWMPDPSCNSYKDARRLTQADIDTIVTWASTGAQQGDPADAPAMAPPRPDLPWVDATLESGVDYLPNTANGPDDYHCFLLDPKLTSTKDVIGFDVVPGVRKQVHHVLLYSASYADAKAHDDATPGEGWTCFGGPETPNPSVVGAWVPGSPITQYPPNTGVRLLAGTAIVMQIHYNNSSSAAQPDRTQLRLQYAKAPVQKPAVIVPQAQSSFVIPPMSQGYSVTDTDAASPIAVQVYGVLPHMHNLGRSIKVSSAKGECFVDIPAWDFHWQQFYFFEQPITFTAGDRRVMTCTWDNPTAKTVTWGEGTGDEMCLNYAYVTY